MKLRIGWDSKKNFLTGFCGPKKGDGHKCMTDFQLVVDIGELDFNVNFRCIFIEYHWFLCNNDHF